MSNSAPLLNGPPDSPPDAPLPHRVDDPARLARIRGSGLLDAVAEPAFERLSRLAAAVLHAPVALVTVVDADRQLFLGCVGLPEPWAERRETPLSHSFCQHPMTSGEPLVITDAREHPLVRDNLAIRDLGVVAYAGVPLVGTDGTALGSFCVIDTKPREWTASEVAVLADLAASATTEIELRDELRRRGEAEREARETNARLHAAMQAGGLGAWSIDLPTGIGWLSAEASTLLGLGGAEGLITVDEWERMMHPDDRQRARHVYDAAVTGDGRYQNAFRVAGTDGSTRWIASVGHLLRAADGTPERMVGTVRDVTAEREADAVRRAAEARLRAFVEAAPLLAWLNRADGSVEFFNQRWADFAGQRPGEQSGMGWVDVLHPDDRPWVWSERQRAVAEGTPYEMELRMRLRDGSYRWFGARVVPVRDASGEIIAWAGAALDIDDRRRAEAELRSSEERFRALVEASAQIVWTTAGDGSISPPQPRWTKFTGQSDDEMRGAGWLEAIHPDDRAMTAREWERATAARSLYVVQHRLRRHDGVYRHMHVRGVPLVDPSGAVREWIGTHTDVTDRVSAEADRERLFRAAETARGEAETANRVKTQFLSAMSHELRTPLNAIGGYAQLLEMGLHGAVTPEQTEALGRIMRAQQHLLTLINDILQFAKLESGQTQLEIVNMPLADLRSRLEPLVEPLAAAKEITFACDLKAPADGAARAAPLAARADRDRVLQILVNLVTNAVKFTGPGGTVAVDAAPAGDWVAVRVRDTGCGIAPDKLETIFEPFVQVGPPRSSRDGVGLGLAISRDLARKMGGDIAVESVPGRGSTFVLTLPAGFP